MRSLMLCVLVVYVAGIRMETKDGSEIFHASADDVCEVKTTGGTMNLKDLPTATTDFGLINFGQLGVYTWVNSWCRQEKLLPGGSGSGSAPCDKQPSYIAKYAPTYCDYAAQQWTSNLQGEQVDGVWQFTYKVTQPAEGWVQQFDTVVTIMCGKNPSGKPIDCVVKDGDSICMAAKEEGQSMTTYKLTYRSPLVCFSGGGGGGGCKAGCAFLIIFFVGGFLYLAAGMAYNYKFKELRGVEMVPHLEFWKSVPGLVKDGGMFAFQKTKELANR
eukprot:TRINITY_DN535_c0_g2_i2.p1 TRINITY_DN535_c0_g2~~TRINITY_DN535_c0_g2_i2.p1  ORF type:complete len:272 (+),score=71.38 TRINITY_DN535_c0_g2_i2:1847-2662(+)